MQIQVKQQYKELKIHSQIAIVVILVQKGQKKKMEQPKEIMANKVLVR